MGRRAGDEQFPDLVLISPWHQPCRPLLCLFPGTALGLFYVSSPDVLPLKRALQSLPTGTPTFRLGVCFIWMPPCLTPEATSSPTQRNLSRSMAGIPKMPSCLSWLTPLQHNAVPWVSNGVTIAVVSAQGQECILRKVSTCDIRACLTVSDSVGQETQDKVEVRGCSQGNLFAVNRSISERSPP